jgi:hypothetical protein
LAAWTSTGQSIITGDLQMKRTHALLALLLATTAGSAIAQSPMQTGLLPTPANRLIGTFDVDVAIGPCNLPNPVAFFSAHNTFHAAGTVSDVNWAHPSTRAGGQGIWKHLGGNKYASRFQFFRYDNPAPAPASGLQDVRTELTLSADGNSYVARINAQQRALDGSPVGPPLCGEAVGERFAL